MPKVNLPLGVYGIYVPATEIVVVPAIDPIEVATCVWAKPLGAGIGLLNLTRFLQQFATSPNASLGGQYGANVLTGFGIVASGSGTVSVSLDEVQYLNMQQPNIRNAGNTPQLIMTPGTFPVAAATPQTQITYVSLRDYWLIGQNNPDTQDILQITGGVTLHGVTIYFGDK